MGVPFEALIPYVIMTAMFGVTVCGVCGCKRRVLNRDI